jgi:hypothetical protein
LKKPRAVYRRIAGTVALTYADLGFIGGRLCGERLYLLLATLRPVQAEVKARLFLPCPQVCNGRRWRRASVRLEAGSTPYGDDRSQRRSSRQIATDEPLSAGAAGAAHFLSTLPCPQRINAIPKRDDDFGGGQTIVTLPAPRAAWLEPAAIQRVRGKHLQVTGHSRAGSA